jgi:zinc transport system permease protein
MIEILSYSFIQRAIIAGILVGFMASYYGVFIVQRRMSFLGSGLAHAAFGGVALGLLLETEPLAIAVPFTVIVSLLITIVKEKTKLSSDTSIGILFAVSVALGIIFISLKEGYSVDAFNYLFGSILAVNQTDLILCFLLTIITILTIFRYWKRWAYATFDSELALSDRLNITKDNYILSVLISVTIVVSIKLVGIVLIAAFIVIPAASSRLVSRTFLNMTLISVIFGITSSILGLFISFWIDIPSGATIILFQALIFLISLIINKTYEIN